MSMNRSLAAFACLNGALAVALGAFAAHGAGPAVKTLLTTGSHYQLVHAVAALVCAVSLGHSRRASVAGWLASVGGLIFSFSLAAIGLLGLTAMGAVAPVGGAMMILAWLLLAYVALAAASNVA
jgi:uncharacterized membrane protein YgdD (TMEM256/DUF423 family)